MVQKRTNEITKNKLFISNTVYQYISVSVSYQNKVKAMVAELVTDIILIVFENWCWEILRFGPN